MIVLVAQTNDHEADKDWQQTSLSVFDDMPCGHALLRNTGRFSRIYSEDTLWSSILLLRFDLDCGQGKQALIK